MVTGPARREAVEHKRKMYMDYMYEGGAIHERL